MEHAHFSHLKTAEKEKIVYAGYGNFKLACVPSFSMRFRSEERGTRIKDRTKTDASEKSGIPFFARPKPKIPFLGLSLLRNRTDTLATQAIIKSIWLSFLN